MERRFRKGAYELLDEGEGAASEREHGTEEYVGTECRDIRVFVEAKIHPGRVRTGRDAVKEWRLAERAAYVHEWRLARSASSAYNPRNE
jgi:hypothetical protein